MSNDKLNSYSEAFYGGDIPETQLDRLNRSVLELVKMFQQDIRAKFSDIDQAMLEAGTIAGLYHLHELGAVHPNIYKSEGNMYVQAFQSALFKVRELRAREVQAVETRQAEAETAEKMSLRSKEAAIVYDYFSQVKEWAFTQGYEYPALEAWKALLENKDIGLEGYTYFLVSWKIPNENVLEDGRSPVLLYDHPEVIQLMNAHPRLPDRKGETKMEINHQKTNFLS